MAHLAADLALVAQGLFLRRFRELMLQGVFLSTVTSLLSGVGTLTLRHCPTLSSLVQVNRVNLMLFAMWTVSPYFFGNVHWNRYQLAINETYAFLTFSERQGNRDDSVHASRRAFSS